MTSQTVRVLTSFALLTLACQPAGAQPPVSISVAGGAALSGAMAQTVFQFGNLLVFSILVGLGLFLRRSRETHKRLLALTVLQTLLAAPVAHLVGHFALPVVLLPLWGLLVLAAFVVHDRRVGDAFTPSRSGEGAD